MNNPDDILSALVVAEVFGNLLLVEPRRDGLLTAVAAAVTDVTVCRASKEAEDDCRELQRLGCQAEPIKPKALGPLGAQSSLLILYIPEGENAEEFLDLALSKVADDGFVLVDIEVESKPQLLRIQRILEASFAEVYEDMGWSEGDRLSVAGRRRARGQELTIEVMAEPVSVTILCYVDDDSQAIDELAVSLLFRQSHLPALVLFLDDGIHDGGALPDDLWGMAAQSPTQPALIRTGGVGHKRAFHQALEHIETDYAVLVESGQMPSPRWIEHLSVALYSTPDAGFAMAGGFSWSVTGDQLRSHCHELHSEACQNSYGIMLSAVPEIPPLGVIMYRSDLLAVILDPDPEPSGAAIAGELLLRACEEASMVSVPLPLLTFVDPSLSQADLLPVMERLHARNTLPRLMDSLSMLPADEVEGIALEVRAEAMLSADAFDQALADYSAALELDPDYPDLRVDFLIALRRACRPTELIEHADPWWTGPEPDVRYGLLLVWALVAIGDKDGARTLLDRLESDYPNDHRVLIDHLVLDENGEVSDIGRRLIDSLDDELVDEISSLCL